MHSRYSGSGHYGTIDNSGVDILRVDFLGRDILEVSITTLTQANDAQMYFGEMTGENRLHHYFINANILLPWVIYCFCVVSNYLIT